MVAQRIKPRLRGLTTLQQVTLGGALLLLPWTKMELFPRVIWADVLFLLWALLLYVQWTFRQRPLWKPPWPLPAFGLLLALWAAALLASGWNVRYPEAYAFEAAAYIYLAALSWLLAYVLSTSPAALITAMNALIAGLVGSIAFGLIGIANAMFFGSFSPVFYNEVYKLIATFKYPNQLAGFLVLFLPVVGVQPLRARGLRSRLVYGALALLMLVEIAASGSRAGLVAALFGLGLVSAYALLKLRLHWIALAGLLATGFAVAIVYLRPSIWVIDRALSALQSIRSGEITDPFRLENWGIALQLFAQNPGTGYGVGNVALDFGYETHNTYLAVVAETGALGLLAFLGLLGFLVVLACQNVRWVRIAPQWHSWALGVWLGLLAELLYATQHHIFRTRHLWVMFAVVVAMNASLRYTARQDAKVRTR